MADFLLFRWKINWKRLQIRSGNMAVSRMCSTKIRNITLIYGVIAEIPASYRKSGSRNTMVSSNFRPEIEILRFAHAQYRRNITLVRNNLVVVQLLWGRYHVPQHVSSSMKHQLHESALKSPKFHHLQGNRGHGVKRRCQIFFTGTA